MPQKLTARSVETIRAGADRREIPDAHLPSLYLIVQPSGAKSWAVRYRHAGATRKHTLGSYPAIDLKAARELASTALRAVAAGRDPAQEKRERVATDTVASLVEQFLRMHCQRRNRPRTAAGTERLLRRHVLPRWRNQPASSISRRDVLDLLDRIVEGGAPIVANRTLAATRKMFNWAVSRDILPFSPCTGVKAPSEERSRDRTLSDSELRDVWKAVDQMGGPYAASVKLLLLTGQRRDEVAGMRWTETDIDICAPFGQPCTWIIPKERTKNEQTHDVPLSRACLDILRNIPRIAGSDFVLTTTGEGPINGFSKNKRQLNSLLPADMPAWRLHDLRRSVASGMARLGINLPVIEKVLNHTSGSFGGIVGVYQRHDFAAEKRAALEAWGRHVEALVTGKPAKVLQLQR
jgi:integrase